MRLRSQGGKVAVALLSLRWRWRKPILARKLWRLTSTPHTTLPEWMQTLAPGGTKRSARVPNIGLKGTRWPVTMGSLAKKWGVLIQLVHHWTTRRATASSSPSRWVSTTCATSTKWGLSRVPHTLWACHQWPHVWLSGESLWVFKAKLAGGELPGHSHSGLPALRTPHQCQPSMP